VVIDAQAWLYAVITEGGDAPEDKFEAAMTAFKEETGDLINQALELLRQEMIAEEEAAKGEEE
jgi:hypothetical protein